MREMKDSGIDYIGQIPLNWKECRLKFLCLITTGNEDTQNSDPDGEFPFYVGSPIIEKVKNILLMVKGFLLLEMAQVPEEYSIMHMGNMQFIKECIDYTILDLIQILFVII